MGFYRTEDGLGTVHINFGRKPGPLPCAARDEELGARCGRMSVALCDYPMGRTLGDKPLTCDAEAPDVGRR